MHAALHAVRAALALVSLGATLSACAPRTPEDCAADVAAMREVLEDAVDAAAGCATDADCAIVDPSNACEDRCPVAVSFDQVDEVSRKILDGELSYCTGYGQECGFTSVTCEARIPACVAGRCEMVSEEG